MKPALRRLVSATFLVLGFSAFGSPRASAQDTEARLPAACSGFKRTASTRLEGVWGTYAWKHTAPVEAVAFTPDGRRVISGSQDETIKTWDASTGQELQTLTGHTGHVLSLALSADGSRLLSGSADGTARLWDLATGRELLRLDGRQRLVFTVAISPDGRSAVTGGFENGVILWDLENGKVVRSFVGHDGPVHAIAFTPDGKRIASGGMDGRLRLWDLASGDQVLALGDGSSPINALAVLNDSHVVAGDSQGKLISWDLTSRTAVLAVQAHEKQVRSVRLSHNGELLVTGGWDNKIRLWEPTTLKPMNTIELPAGVRDVGISPDSKRVVSATQDRRLRLWELDSGEVHETPYAYRAPVVALASRGDGAEVLSGDANGMVDVWDAATGTLKLTLAAHEGAVSSLAYIRSGTVAITGGNGKFGTYGPRIWDLETGKKLSDLQAATFNHTSGFRGEVRGLGVLPDGSAILCGGVGELTVLSFAGVHRVRMDTREATNIRAVGIVNAEGRPLGVTGGYEGLMLWDLDSGSRMAILEPYTSEVSTLATTPHGSLIVAALNDRPGTLHIWSARSKTLVAKLVGHTEAVTALAFSPDGKRILSGSLDGTVRIWSSETGDQLDRIALRTSTDKPRSICFLPGSRSFVVGTERGVILRFELRREAR